MVTMVTMGGDLQPGCSQYLIKTAGPEEYQIL